MDNLILERLFFMSKSVKEDLEVSPVELVKALELVENMLMEAMLSLGK
jgi:hypothetical protein